MLDDQTKRRCPYFVRKSYRESRVLLDLMLKPCFGGKELFRILTFLFILNLFQMAFTQDARFSQVSRRAKRTESHFKLAKIEELNAQARKQKAPPIAYKSFQVQYTPEMAGLDFVFSNLTETQFEEIKSVYGGQSRVQFKAGTPYRLVDFLAPAIGAVDGHVFRYAIPTDQVLGKNLAGQEVLSSVTSCAVLFAGSQRAIGDHDCHCIP